MVSLILTSLHFLTKLWEFPFYLHYSRPDKSGHDIMHTVNALHKLMNRRQLQVAFYLSLRVFASPQTQKRHGAHTWGNRVNKLGAQQTSALFGHWRLTKLGPDLHAGTRANGAIACLQSPSDTKANAERTSRKYADWYRYPQWCPTFSKLYGTLGPGRSRGGGMVWGKERWEGKGDSGMGAFEIRTRLE